MVTLSLSREKDEVYNCEKNMRFLCERFFSKVTAMEESRDFINVKVEDTVGALLAYELTFKLNPKRPKGIA